MAWWMAIPAAISAATSLYEALDGGKPSGQEQEWLNKYKYRMEHGLSPDERVELHNTYAPGIARGVSTRQNRMAAMFASRGLGRSTYASREIGGIPSVGETVAPILAEANQRARETAEHNYLGLSTSLNQRREASQAAGFAGLGQALGAGFSAFLPTPKNPLQDAIINYLNTSLGSLGQTAAQATSGMEGLPEVGSEEWWYRFYNSPQDLYRGVAS
ncbi:MAG: hypothetical protein C4519_00345 [Desulfobacteraceae bacterium]|nr:MAG: hypothetical protein C4519_00345 [Desulfobacteraceae bacterium]